MTRPSLLTPGPPLPPGPWLRLTALAATVATAVVVATGSWPGTPHDSAALVALALLVGVALSVWLAHRDRRDLLVASSVALGLYAVQVALGAVVEWADLSGTKSLHIALGAASLAAAAVSTALVLRRGPPAPAGSWRDYVTLTKPRIMTLLLLTAAGGMVVGEGGLPPLGLFLATMIGLALACGGASALNHYLDRDIDIHMKRTDRRPVATGRIAPERALEFVLALSALSFVVLASFVNVLAALLAVFGNLFYVIVYTRWLKRTTPQNIVIGGAAGAIPPLVGWAAATGNLTLPALFLFLIVFVWTPPHFWALALLIKGDYEAAKVPMLPVVRGDRETARQIVLYSLLLVGVTVLPFAWQTLGFVYLASAAALGIVFVGLALALARHTDRKHAHRLFTYSLTYLALLFVAMAIDPIVLS
jgi:protoheme IX farnesyltransferase